MSFWDKSKLVECPTLRPTQDEFACPISYLSRPDIKRLGDEFGILKVVPPSNWRPQFALATDFKFHTRLQRLSDLGLSSRSRKFFTDNINRFQKMRRRKPLRSYFRALHTRIHYYDLYVAVENLGGVQAITDSTWTQLNAKFNLPGDSMALQEEYMKVIKPYAVFLSDNESAQFPTSDSEDEYESCLICGKHDAPTRTLLCDNCDSPFHLKCLDPPLSSIPDGEWYCNKCLIGTGEYGFEEEVDVKYTLKEFFDLCDEFTNEFMEEHDIKHLTVDTIEKIFWDLVEQQNSDIEVKYGADIHNLIPGQISGFPMMNTPEDVKARYPEESFKYYENHPFNLTNLPFAKGSLLNYIENPISGMTVPWIYIGSLLSTFCWHVEDHYTLSANYCHFGSTKKWYAIPSKDADAFEQLMRNSAPDLFKKQPDLLHQLVTLLSPMKIVENGIKCCYADQNPNEFVVTFPRVYHAGFNSGFNFNEAVNFTMSSWLEFGEKSIGDYKLIKKENVFNHYQLVENILRKFVEGDETMSLLLIRDCLACYKKFMQKNFALLDKLDNSDFQLEHKRKEHRIRNFARERALVYEEGDGEDDEEEPLCDCCRTHLAFHYCIIDNAERDFAGVPKGPRQTTPYQEQLLTPQTTPTDTAVKAESSADIPKSSERLAEVVKADSEADAYDSEADADDGEADEESTKSAKKRPVPEFERLAKMIEEEKRRKVEDGSIKVRKSNRLEALVKRESSQRPATQSKMGMVATRSTLKHLNSKDQIQLCMECLLKCYEYDKDSVANKSKVISEIYPHESESFITQVTKELERRSG